jgi:hypothetical protein
LKQVFTNEDRNEIPLNDFVTATKSNSDFSAYVDANSYVLIHLLIFETKNNIKKKTNKETENQQNKTQQMYKKKNCIIKINQTIQKQNKNNTKRTKTNVKQNKSNKNSTNIQNKNMNM